MLISKPRGGPGSASPELDLQAHAIRVLPTAPPSMVLGFSLTVSLVSLLWYKHLTDGADSLVLVGTSCRYTQGQKPTCLPVCFSNNQIVGWPGMPLSVMFIHRSLQGGELVLGGGWEVSLVRPVSRPGVSPSPV